MFFMWLDDIENVRWKKEKILGHALPFLKTFSLRTTNLDAAHGPVILHWLPFIL